MICTRTTPETLQDGELGGAIALCLVSQVSKVVGASRASGPARSTSPAASTPKTPFRQLGISRIDSPQADSVRPAMSTKSCGSGPARSVARPRDARRDLGENVADVGGRDRLHQQRRHDGHLPHPRPPDHLRGKLVELCGALDREGNRPGGEERLLHELTGVVRVSLQTVHADDGQQHVVPDLCPLLGGQEVWPTRRGTPRRQCRRARRCCKTLPNRPTGQRGGGSLQRHC
jgi:hypothetical protein